MEREWDTLSHGKNSKTLISQSAYDELESTEGKYFSERIESYFTMFELLLAPKSNPLLAVEELHFAKKGSMTSGEFHSHIVKIAKRCKFPNPEAEERAIRDAIFLGMNSQWARDKAINLMNEEAKELTVEFLMNQLAIEDCNAKHKILSQLNSSSSVNFAAYNRRQNKGKSNKSKHTIVDFKKGYWMVVLHPDSRKLTCMALPFGRFQLTQLPMGTVVAQDIFQSKLDAIFIGMEGVTGITDDMIIAGKDEMEHNRNFLAFMERCMENNLTLNSEKIQFKQSQVSFYGHIWSKHSISPDPKKIQALKHMEFPPDKETMRSFLGMNNYLNRYSALSAHLAAPLSTLRFIWRISND